MYFRITDRSTGRLIAEQVEVAGSLWRKLWGLAGIALARAPAGLWLCPTNGIHTVGMRFSLDIIVLDRNQRVAAVIRGLRPNRIALPVKRGYSTIEVPAGSAALPAPGDHLDIQPVRLCEKPS